jgi:hypothetical protein
MANPKGNPENLDPVRSNAEAKKRGAAGGIASGKARREKKRLRELAQMILDEEITDKATGQVMTQGEAALRVQARKAIMDGDTKALGFLRDTAGQAPVSQVEVATVDQAKFNELLEQLEAGE